MALQRRYILSLSCPDRVGIVAAVSSFLAQHKIWIVEARHHADPDTNTFFMRHEVLSESCPFTLDELRWQFEPIRAQFNMTCSITANEFPKRVGATCHYVTNQLDEGPIIEQDAFRTNHADTVDEMIRMGRDVEKAVLARGLRYHLEDRVLLNGNRTVVFD